MRISRILVAGVMAGGFSFVAACNDMPISINEPNGTPSDASASYCSGTAGSVGKNGGTIDCLSFAIIGDTRPAGINGTSSYPTAIINKIYQDIEAASPRPALAVGTGDYMFAKKTSSEANPQLDMYLTARAFYSGPFFPTMGNHECTGAASSNCGTGAADGNTNNYTAYLSKMLGPIGQSKPYYSINVKGTNNAWTAKFVFVAANAWSTAQGTWLDQVLSQPTTYTFIVRHEPNGTSGVPGLKPSETIINAHPFTLLLTGHTHTFKYIASTKEIVDGIGGAPLTGGAMNYGYVLARQRVDGALQFFVYDYQSHALLQTFAVDANGNQVSTTAGTPTPTPAQSPTPTPSGTNPSPTPTPGSGSDLITNGGFEGSLSGWTLGGAKLPIDSTAEARTGTHALRAGATTSTEPSGDSWAYQTVTIPQSASSATLTFYYFMKSADTTPHDYQEAQIRDANGNMLESLFHVDDNSASWTQKSVDLSTYRGQTIQIWFNCHGDGGTTPTTLWVDDVSLVVN